MNLRPPFSSTDASSAPAFVFHVSHDGAWQRDLGAIDVNDEELQDLCFASHLDELSSALGQRIRYSAQKVLSSGQLCGFQWSHWEEDAPTGRDILIQPCTNGAEVSVGQAVMARSPLDRLPWLAGALDRFPHALVVVESEQTPGGEPHVLHVNRHFTRLSGFTAEAAFGAKLRALSGSENGQSTGSMLRALARQDGWVEKEWTRRDGAKYRVEVQVEPIKDETGWLTHWLIALREPAGSVGAMPGVSLADRALHFANVGIVVTDGHFHDGGPRVLYANDEFCRLVGRTTAELAGVNPFAMLGTSPDLAALTTRNGDPVAGIGAVCHTKNGRQTWLRWQSLAPVYDESSRLTQLVAILEDVTADYADAEVQTRDSRSESIGFLAAGTAHDLNNILASVGANAALAKREYPVDPAFAEDCLREVEEAVVSASVLTRQLLTFARSESVPEGPVHLPKLLRAVVKFCLLGSDVRPKLELNNLSPAVLADEAGLRQAISNVVINACEAMLAGGTCTVRLNTLTLAPGAVPSLSPGNYAQVTITDTGAGIPPENLARVFDPRFTTKKAGRGLGLTVARRIVQSQGGDLTIDSTPGVGTTVSIHLPVYAGALEEAPSVDPEVIRGSGRILLVEDDAMLREGLERSVRTLGYEPTLAADGAEALELYRAAHGTPEAFKLVVLDLTVPGGLGAKATLPELRRFDPQAKVVVASGYNEADVLTSVSELGFNGLLPKPHTFAELSRVLAEAMGG